LMQPTWVASVNVEKSSDFAYGGHSSVHRAVTPVLSLDYSDFVDMIQQLVCILHRPFVLSCDG